MRVILGTQPGYAPELQKAGRANRLYSIPDPRTRSSSVKVLPSGG
jgi:hypothetical protein